MMQWRDAGQADMAESIGIALARLADGNAAHRIVMGVAHAAPCRGVAISTARRTGCAGAWTAFLMSRSPYTPSRATSKPKRSAYAGWRGCSGSMRLAAAIHRRQDVRQRNRARKVGAP